MTGKSKKMNMNESVSTDSVIDLEQFLATLVDFRWLIIGVTSFFAVLGILYATFSTPIYSADALVQVEQNAGSSILKDLTQMLPESTQPESAAEIELIKSRLVLGKTINDLNLDTVVEQHYFPIFGKGLARLTGKNLYEVAVSRFSVPKYLYDKIITLKILNDSDYALEFDGNVLLEGKVGVFYNKNGISILISDVSAPIGTTFDLIKKENLTVINEILDNLDISDKGKDTGVLGLSLTGEDPNVIQRVLNSITNNYLEQNVARKSEEAAKSLDFLKEQLPSVRGELDLAESKLNQYRQNKDSVDLSLEAKSVLDTMVSIETQLNELTFKEAEISKLYTKEHPSYRALLEKRKVLEDEKDKINKKISNMPQTQQEILRLTRDVQAGQEIYMQLLNKQQELSISKASTVGNVRIIDDAQTQPKPVQPKKKIIVILSILVGLIVSVLSVLIRAIFHKGIESPEDLESIGINVYAAIPLSDWQRKIDQSISENNRKKGHNIGSRNRSLLAISNPADLAIESIRSLRTSLHFAMMDTENNAIMISGASPGIGKSFVSMNLAAVIAQSGMKVLMIDADMRKGYAHEVIGISNDKGLSSILSKRHAPPECIITSEENGFDIIPRGQIPPNPSELLMGKEFESLIKWGSENYDFILIDTPPILAVTDAAIIGTHVGTALLVARYETNTTKEVEISIRRFEQNGVNIKGVILNAMVKKATSYYSYYQYEYSSSQKGK